MFPECALSGYPSESRYADIPSLKNVDPQTIESDLDEVKELARRLGLWVCLGTVRHLDGVWHNDALLVSDKGAIEGVYSKVNLTDGDEKYFVGVTPFLL